MESLCNHKHFTNNCEECNRALISQVERDEQIDNLEAEIIKAYEVGGFRGITKLILDKEAHSKGCGYL